MERINERLKSIETLASLYDYAVREYGKLPMMKKKHSWGYQAISYNEFGRLISFIGTGLIERGLKTGTKVAIIAENSPEWALVYAAVTASGAVIVPLDAQLNENEIRHLLLHSEARFLVASEKVFNEKIDSMGLRDIDVIVIGEKKSSTGFTSLGDLMASGKEIINRGEGEFFKKKSDVTADDIAAICYTSGTTGTPRGAVLIHRNITADVKGCVERIPADSKDVFLNLLPMHHTFSTTTNILVPISIGASIVFGRSMKPRDIKEDIQRENVTVLIGVPLIFEHIISSLNKTISEKPKQKQLLFAAVKKIASSIGRLFKRNVERKVFAKQLDSSGLGSLRFCISGAARLRRDVEDAMFSIGLPVLQGYGMTETSPVISVNPLDRPKKGTVGPPLPGVEVKIENPDENGIGEILVRGANVMKEYYRNPEATAEALRNGWLHTGDLAKIDKDGYITFVGRKKSVVVTEGGKNIYLEELESVLNGSPCILESAVVPVKDNRGNDSIAAIVVPDYNTLSSDGRFKGNLSEELITETIAYEIKRLCSELPDYKKIRDFQIRNEELPKTTTQKIKRHLVKWVEE